MFDSETDGNAKGSLKDRLRILNILIRISRHKKMNLSFSNINSEKINNSNHFFLFFYNPVKVILDKELEPTNTIVYDGLLNTENASLTPNNNTMVTDDFDIIKKSKKKKGIDYENIEKESDALDEKEQIKEEIIQKYDLPKEKVSEVLINDYKEIKNNISELVGHEVSDEIKEELIADRIKADDDINNIHNIVELEKDIYLGRDIDYDLKVNSKNYEKLNKALEQEKKKIEMISRKIDEYTISRESNLKISNLSSLLSGTIGIGVGLLTLPFSFSKAFALGTNMIRNSLNKINTKVKFNYTTNNIKNYQITQKDIATAEKALKSSDFLLEDILDNLDHLKYKIKLLEYKIPDVNKKLKEIEVLEEGLVKKKRELKKMVESFEKNKTKTLSRDTKAA